MEGENVPKFHYCNKPGHVKKDFQKRLREENKKQQEHRKQEEIQLLQNEQPQRK